MANQGDPFSRLRANLVPQGIKFSSLEDLYKSGLHSSSYLTSAMDPADVMLLSSSGMESSSHLPNQSEFASRQRGETKSSHITSFGSLAFPGRAMFGQGDHQTSYPSQLTAPLLSLHHPLLAYHNFSRDYLSAGAGLYRSLGLIDNRSYFQGCGTYLPSKYMKLDHSASASAAPEIRTASHFGYHGNDSITPLSPSDSTSTTASSAALTPLTPDMGLTMGIKAQKMIGITDADEEDLRDGLSPLSEDELYVRVTPDNCYSQNGQRSQPDSQTPCCPLCGSLIEVSEWSEHLMMETERVVEFLKNIHTPFGDCTTSVLSSPPLPTREVNLRGKYESRWETFQRVKSNRHNRLKACTCGRRKRLMDDTPPPPPVQFPSASSSASPVFPVQIFGSGKNGTIPQHSSGNHNTDRKDDPASEDEPVDVDGE